MLSSMSGSFYGALSKQRRFKPAAAA